MSYRNAGSKISQGEFIKNEILRLLTTSALYTKGIRKKKKKERKKISYLFRLSVDFGYSTGVFVETGGKCCSSSSSYSAVYPL